MRPQPLLRPQLPPSFDKVAALQLATELADRYPDRSPGSAGAIGAASWFADQLQPLGFESRTDEFTANVPGEGNVVLRNISTVAVAPTSSPQVIVVMAHRDNTGTGPGANDNASGTAALLELARAYGRPATTSGRAVSPAHTIVFLSTDGGAFGAIGAEHFAQDSPYRSRVVAVINLDAVAGTGPPRLEIGGYQPRSPAGALVETAAARIEDQSGRPPGRTSGIGQLIDLGFPFSLYEQAPFVARGISAVTLTTGGDRPPSSYGDASNRLDETRLGQVGRSAQALLSSLDEGLELAPGTSSYVYLGQRLVRGWAIELSLFAMLLPFLVAVVDLFARCRRRGISLAPALRSYRSRLLFWLWAGALFELLGLAGAWPGGPSRPVNPESAAAGRWPTLGLSCLAIALLLSWLVGRDRLRQRRPPSAEQDLAGHAAALIALGIVALVVVALNPFALIFVLVPLHVWLWLPQVRERPGVLRVLVLLTGFLGPLLLLGSFAIRFGLGFDALWYIAELRANGYIPIVVFMVVLAWTAGTAQLVALTAGRYAPYPHASERPPRGPFRNTVRAVALVLRTRRRRADEGRPAQEA